MKNIFYIFFIILFSCNNISQENEPIGLSDNEAYLLINKFIIPEILKTNSRAEKIYWSEIIIQQPEKELINYNFEEDFLTEKIPPPPPPVLRLTDEKWNLEKIGFVARIYENQYKLIFKTNNSQDIESKWQELFGEEYLYFASYPLFNVKTSTAAIKVFRYKPFLTCGTGSQSIYFFKREDNGWKMLDYNYL